MNTGAYSGMMLMLSRFMGIAPGMQLRKYYRGSNADVSSSDVAATLLEQNEFVNTIVDITADDVCIGCNPFYLQGVHNVMSVELREKYTRLIRAINKIAKWAAIDLLKRGSSLYSFAEQPVEDKATGTQTTIPVLIPITDPVRFYMDKFGVVSAFIGGKKAGADVLVFLNYAKESLIPIKDALDAPKSGSYLYEVTPAPIQLSNVQQVALDLYQVERAIYRYRVQLSRIVRFAEVEAGIQLGNDGNNLAVDNAAAAVNANSQSMDAVMLDPVMSFDDNLPVVPTHGQVGKISIVSDIPDFDSIKELPDLEHALNRLFLAMRFPKSYADFSQSMGDTAVSLIRGDVRYARMVDYTRSVMEDAVNRRMFGPMFDPTTAETFAKLTSLPNSEDDDVVEALDNFQQFAQSSMEFISSAEDRDDALTRLKSITILLGDTANLAAIQRWDTLMGEYIDTKFGDGTQLDDPESDPGASSEEDPDMSTGDEEPTEGDDAAAAVNPDNEGPAAFDLPPVE